MPCLLSYPPAQSVVYPVRIESSSASLANGHTLDLNCLVASHAPHTITWYKRGGSLPSRHQVRRALALAGSPGRCSVPRSVLIQSFDKQQHPC
jgi:hypothetical protein